MKLSSILNESFATANIVPWDEMADDYDPWVTADQAEAVAKNSGIRISSDKELSFIALDDRGDVVGAIWTSFIPDDIGAVFDFDVAVDKSSRGGNIGLQLIDAALGLYEDQRDMADHTYIRVWVVNPKLVRVLERKYGFEISNQYADGSAHMEYHS